MTPEDESSIGVVVVSDDSDVAVLLSPVVSVEVSCSVVVTEVLSEEVLSESDEVTERLLSSDLWLWHPLAEKRENKTVLASKNERDFLNCFMG